MKKIESKIAEKWAQEQALKDNWGTYKGDGDDMKNRTGVIEPAYNSLIRISAFLRGKSKKFPEITQEKLDKALKNYRNNKTHILLRKKLSSNLKRKTSRPVSRKSSRSGSGTRSRSGSRTRSRSGSRTGT